MVELEERIKLAFLQIYFEKPYLIELNNHIINLLYKIKGIDITENKKIYENGQYTGLTIPDIPEEFIIRDNDELFITGLKASRYFIG